ncbi:MULTISPECIES: signal peptidase I [Lactobacillaceae]|uniref:Signal peptidase I n=1 Tax=Limosilactobacillus alvi TaxID=990412 RepID=A0ABS2ELV3_9LACO|nr:MULTISPECIES: signal peptidase I [Lactobacillaceae]MBM6753492.1 signal peptidase I [Limosilactobacillus alvi]QLL70935.1 signal peptidase I [Lactobacillus sp. 3B(2020)]
MKAFKQVMSWVIPVVIGLLIAFLIRAFVLQPVRVDGPSMLPNLQNNERVITWKQAKIHRGSVVVFDANGVDPQVSQKTYYVKRVIGLPGDTVEAKNGKLYVNGKLVRQSYINKYQRKEGTGNWTLKSISVQNSWLKNSGTTKVPAGEYFVLGDHRSVSNDSRYYGFVPKSKLLGVVHVGFWSGNQTKKSNVNDEWKHYFQAN